MSEQRLTKYIFLILYFQSALGLRLYKLNTIAEEDVVPKLSEIIDGAASLPKTGYRKNSIFFKEKPNYRRTSLKSTPFLGKSMLVSRIIPHGYKAGAYEYDSKLNTIYKPLIRFHVKKPIEDINHEIVEVITEKPKILGYVLAVKKKGKQKQNDLLTQIRNILNANKNTRYGKENSKRSFRSRSNTDLITKLLDKSSEDFDGLRPGIHYNDEGEKLPPEPLVVIPDYPFWNFWTYSKTIHQDDCPGSLVKLGNVCVAPSGHRKAFNR